MATKKAAKKGSARSTLAHRVGDIVAARRDGSLGGEYIKFAQALLLCTLPYRPTDERQVSRRAKIGFDAWVEVTFTANLPGGVTAIRARSPTAGLDLRQSTPLRCTLHRLGNGQ